jgi:hypothetical protein
MEVFERLNEVAGSDDLSDFLSGLASTSGVERVLEDMVAAVNSLLDPASTIDLSVNSAASFLRISLPIFVELLLRRKSKR